jgi:hypothetical protein
MTPDEKIAAFLGSARPATDAPAFNAEVMQRVAREEFGRAMAYVAIAALVGGLMLWAVAPILSVVAEALAPTLITGAGLLVVTVSLVVMAEGYLRRA